MAKTISGKNVTSTDEIVLDPQFFLPPGIVGTRVLTPDEIAQRAGSYVEEEVEATFDYQDDVEGEEFFDPGFTIDNPALLDAPSSVTIVSQTVRETAGGQSVVDVVIEVNDVPGVTEYQIRETKG